MIFIVVLSCFLFFLGGWQRHLIESIPDNLKQADCFGRSGFGKAKAGIGYGGPIERIVRLRECPILQKNQFAALARLVLVMCGAESCSCYRSCLIFIFVVSVSKHLLCHLSCFLLNQGVMNNVCVLLMRGAGRVLPFSTLKCYRLRGGSSLRGGRVLKALGVGCCNYLLHSGRMTPLAGAFSLRR